MITILNREKAKDCPNCNMTMWVGEHHACPPTPAAHEHDMQRVGVVGGTRYFACAETYCRVTGLEAV